MGVMVVMVKGDGEGVWRGCDSGGGDGGGAKWGELKSVHMG